MSSRANRAHFKDIRDFDEWNRLLDIYEPLSRAQKEDCLIKSPDIVWTIDPSLPPREDRLRTMMTRCNIDIGPRFVTASGAEEYEEIMAAQEIMAE